MRKRVKKSNKLNTNKINDNNSLIDNAGRSRPMIPKAGVTLYRSRYKFGGKYA